MLEQIAEIVSFLIICWVIYRFVWPLVGKMVRERQDIVQQQVDDSAEAERLNAEAARRYDEAVEEARGEAARMRDDARADAVGIRDEMIAEAKAEVARIKQRGIEQLAAERDQVVRGLRGEVGGQSMDLAQQIVVESMASEANRATSVDDVLANLGNLPVRGVSAPAGVTGGGA